MNVQKLTARIATNEARLTDVRAKAELLQADRSAFIARCTKAPKQKLAQRLIEDHGQDAYDAIVANGDTVTAKTLAAALFFHSPAATELAAAIAEVDQLERILAADYRAMSRAADKAETPEPVAKPRHQVVSDEALAAIRDEGDKAPAINELLAELEAVKAAKDRNRAKAIRAQLRRLGYFLSKDA